MTTQIERRITDLERQSGIGTAEAAILADLADDDARFYRSVMARPGSGNFETFVRTLDEPELERLLDIHMGHLVRAGVTEADLADEPKLLEVFRERVSRG